MTIRIRVVSVIVSSIVFCLPSAWGGKELGIAMSERSLVVSHASAGGEVLIVGYVHVRQRYFSQQVRYEWLTRASETGDATVSLNGPVSSDAFWVAVDLTTASFAAVAPAGARLRHAELPPGAIKGKASPQGRDKLSLDIDYIHAVLVRPGVGAWNGTIGDGGASDDDGKSDRKLNALAARLKRVGGTGDPPTDFQNGDLLLILVPHQMRYMTTKVKP